MKSKDAAESSHSSTFDLSNPPPASSSKELLDPNFVMRSLDSLLALPDAMNLSSVSRSDSTGVIKAQVLFLVGATLTSIKSTPGVRGSPGQPAVGLIGCGLMGSAIVDALLLADMPPQSIMIASRDEQKVARFLRLGCRSGSDTNVVESCKILVVCVAPQHLRALGNEVRRVKYKKQCLVISTIAGVSSNKIAKLCGISRVTRTIVDLVQLPVAWDDDEEENRNSAGGEATLTQDIITVGAKNLVAQKGILASIQSSIESLAIQLGSNKEQAKIDVTQALVGDGDKGESPIKRKKLDNKQPDIQEGIYIEQQPTPFVECANFLKYWKDNIASGMWEVIAEELYVKDLIF